MSAETIHASCVAIGGRAVLITGRSGSGKSDLALRLIDRGATLVSDDYTLLTPTASGLSATAPERIRGRIEIRGVGLMEEGFEVQVPVCLVVALDSEPERLPEPRSVRLAGVDIPWAALSALEASAPIKLERALLRFGLPIP